MTLSLSACLGRPAYFITLLTIIGCVSCKKSGSDDVAIQPVRTDFTLTNDEVNQSAAPGFGSSTAQPTGSVFTWPAGLQLVGNIAPTDGILPDSTTHTGGSTLMLVDLSFRVVNRTSKPVRLILPGGLIFVSSDNNRQNGFLIQSDTLMLKPDTTTIEANLYCLNDNRMVAYGPVIYQAETVTQLPAMVDLVHLLSTKALSYRVKLSGIQRAEVSSTVQDAVWQVAHTGKLPAGLRTQLEQLP